MAENARQIYALYLTRFANSFGLVTLLTLLPTYIDLLDPSGLEIGLFTTGLTLAQAVVIIPLAWGGDRFDKRQILLGGLGVGIVAYGAFALVDSSGGFILSRGLQGVAATGIGLMTLALVGELAPPDRRANIIGTSNSWRFGASIGGALSAGVLYETFGFSVVFSVLVSLLALGFLAVWLFVEPDGTTVEGFRMSDLALNRRILTMTTFRAPYALSVTLVRTWVPIYAGVEAARGGLAYGAVAVSLVITAEKLTNMLAQPYTGRLSDRRGRARFVFLGGGLYGLIALAVPFAPAIGSALGIPGTFPLLEPLSPAFVPLLLINAALGVADSIREPASMALFADEGSDDGGIASSFGVRSLVWRPGSIVAPMVGGFLMTSVGMAWVFYVGGAVALAGVGTFLTTLLSLHGRAALSAW